MLVRVGLIRWIAVLCAGLSSTALAQGERVVGGHEAAPGVWPYQASILIREGSGVNICGGTLIAPQFVLTAGHCVVDFQQRQIKAADTFLVRVNSVLLMSGGEEHPVKRVILHEEFSKAFPLENDIALLELEQASKAPLARIEGIADANNTRGAIARDASPWAKVIGWGRTRADAPDPSLKLMEASVQVIDEKRCARRMEPLLSELGPIDARRVCGGTSDGGVDSCHGDSGGPLLVPAQGGGWVQVGIVSYGVKECGAKGTYSIYARTGAYADWIERQIGGTTSAPPASPPAPIAQGAPGAAPTLEEGATGGSDFVSVAIRPGARLRVGQPMLVDVRSTFDGYLLLIDLNEKNEAQQLFPNPRSEQAHKDGAVKGGSLLTFPDDTYGFRLFAAPPIGRGRLIAIVTKSKVGLEELMNSEEGLQRYPDATARFAAIEQALRTKGAADPNAPEWAAAFRDYVVVP
jgi:secreted trypsin-like serine protease